MYEALRHANNVPREQRGELESQRHQLTNDIERSDNGVSQKGIEQRIGTVDQRLAAIDKQIAAYFSAAPRRTTAPGGKRPSPSSAPAGKRVAGTSAPGGRSTRSLAPVGRTFTVNSELMSPK